MRRTTKRALVNLTLFGGALAVILFLSLPYSATKSKTFAWTTVRYKTTAASLPEARGICPGLTQSSKPALIVSRVEADGDPGWLNQLAKLYHLCVYNVDTPIDVKSTNLQVPANRGHEGMAYLTFIIDNYANIPEAGAVFVHGSRWAWHNDAKDYDNAASLSMLNISSALSETGYHNLRCDWVASTCSTETAPPQGSLETSVRAVLEPWNARVISDSALPRALATLFGGDKLDKASHATSLEGNLHLGRNDAIRSQCCAQFVVARERLWQHSRDEYVALRQWLLDGSSTNTNTNTNALNPDFKPNPLTPKQHQPFNPNPNSNRNRNAAPQDDKVAGRILSYIWHILFLPPSISTSTNPNSNPVHDLRTLNALACPTAEDCYCRLYGRCNLKGCTSPGRCMGQYRVPLQYRLPDDWAETHS